MKIRARKGAGIAAVLAFALAFPRAAIAGEGDRPYGRAELAAMLAGHAVEFFDGSVSRYRADGAYSYKYAESDRPWLGSWQVPADGQVCVTFSGGHLRCDSFVDDGARMVLVTADGMRFPVRERRALVDGY